MELDVIVELVVVPIRATTPKSSLTRLYIAVEMAITDDVGEVVTSGPVFTADARVPLHDVWFSKVIPGAPQAD
jgi:hypothetical protein